MIPRPFIFILILLLTGMKAAGQEKSLVNTSSSPFAKLSGVNITDVQWTEGFWAERFQVCRHAMVPHMMGNYMNDTLSHGFANFEIAAGLKDGEHRGPAFHDGDFYKMLEGMIMVNAISPDDKTERQIDSVISVIAKTQREDGYIHTPVIIEQRRDGGEKREFAERLDFETYNMGHLMTAACLHYRTTGKTALLDIARKATDFLYRCYQQNPEALAQNAICPSHYMGTAEMFRTTHDQRYLDLAKACIDLRSRVMNGTDDNQDRLPFRQQNKAVGHAVRANYLYAGVADVYMETGEDSLFTALDAIWHDVTERKLYITGGCGALYNGVSPDGTTYKQSPVQQVHQAYGREFQLPNLTAHNESCANIGNLMWNWRMLLATADARYADIMEMIMYNSLLAGVSLDGENYFYTNPLCVSKDLPYTLRWSKIREPYIRYCNCCPPNTIRTIAGISNYFYCLSDAGLWVNFYGGCRLSARLNDGSAVELTQTTDYPWNGNITIRIGKAPGKAFSLFLRIPSWAHDASVQINGRPCHEVITPGRYVEINKTWKKGDLVNLSLLMEACYVEANPLVEETRGQAAVRLGPVVYCLESPDIPAGHGIFDYTLDASSRFRLLKDTINNNTVVFLTGEILQRDTAQWKSRLYQVMKKDHLRKVTVRLVPYYAWGNRGKSEMTVWMPVLRSKI